MYSVTAAHAKHPGFISRCLYIHLLGLVAHYCNPATWGQGYWDGTGNHNLVLLEEASCCLGPLSRVETSL